MESFWVRLFLIASLSVDVSFQRSISEETDASPDESNYRAEYDEFPLEIESNQSKCTCDWRHMIHYEAKGCIAIDKDSCDCPTKFDCPDMNEIEEDNTVCTYKGKRYQSGARINTTNPCERCRCSRGPVSEMICYLVECPEFQNRLPPNCHHVYENNHCCPKTTVCLEDIDYSLLLAEGRKSVTCNYNGQTYPLGARMYSNEDPCEICVCTEDWNGINGTGCYLVDCALEKKREKLLEGCVPIYNQDTCCPIDFYCASDDKFLAETTSDAESNVFEDSGCMFGGKFYNLGQSSSQMVSGQCVTCSCQVPPDLTCVKQKCPPNPDETFCTPYHTSLSCCPLYDCLFGDESLPNNHTSGRLIDRVNRELEDDGSESSQTEPEGTCFETQCEEGMTCLLYQVKCGNTSCSVPTCLKTNSSCTTSTCASGCVVTEQNQDKCMTCVCGKDTENEFNNLKCDMPQCQGETCHLIGGSDGCPACSCINECPELRCEPGCNVVLERESDCPKCICEDETVGCPTPICAHSGCRIENSDEGCPTCICDRSRSRPAPSRQPEESVSIPSAIWPQQPQQQQQQQQQQSGDIVEDKPENAPSASAEDYGDDAMLMSGSAINQNKENIEERASPENIAESLENIEFPEFGWRIMDPKSIRQSDLI